jgi:hypothetical protein
MLDVVVRGRMNLNRRVVLSSGPAGSNHSSSDNGNRPRSTGTANRPLIALQNAVRGNSFSHHCRQRSIVRRLTSPIVSPNRATRAAVTPCRNALTRTTTAATYTRRDRNRNDAGVVLFRQPSSAQQKLHRIA